MTSPASLEASPLVDCRGMQCPAPILRLSEAARKHRGMAGTLTVLATDVDFPVDLDAWCRTTKSSLVRLEQEQDGVIRAQIRLAGSPAVAAPTLPAATPDMRPPPVTPTPRSMEVDLTGLPIVAAMRRVNEASIASPGRCVTFVSDAPGFGGRLAAWASATEATLESMHREGERSIAVVKFAGELAPSDPAPVEVRPAPDIVITPKSLEPAVSSQEVTLPAASPRENRATLLVLHNDLEALLAALMVANASAAQGMEVQVYFAFWGVHLLRGEHPRMAAAREKPGFFQRMILWMVPKGPQRQKLGKLHMGGLGTRILLRLMRKRNILALDKLVEAAATQGVKFRVCSMSMGLMGLDQRDIIDMPNLGFAGVTSFAEVAGRSSVSLVF